MQDRRFGSRGPCRTRHLAPSAFRTLSTLYTLRPLPGLFHPGDARGVLVFRALYFPGKPPPLSRPDLLSCRSADRTRPPCGERARDARLQSLHPPGESRHAGRNPRGRCPPDVRPSRDLRARVVGRICTGRRACAPRPARPPPPCGWSGCGPTLGSPALPPVRDDRSRDRHGRNLRSGALPAAGAGVSSSRRRRPSWGSSPRPRAPSLATRRAWFR
jgi:hypothetical protein